MKPIPKHFEIRSNRLSCVLIWKWKYVRRHITSVINWLKEKLFRVQWITHWTIDQRNKQKTTEEKWETTEFRNNLMNVLFESLMTLELFLFPGACFLIDFSCYFCVFVFLLVEWNGKAFCAGKQFTNVAIFEKTNRKRGKSIYAHRFETKKRIKCKIIFNIYISKNVNALSVKCSLTSRTQKKVKSFCRMSFDNIRARIKTE